MQKVPSQKTRCCGQRKGRETKRVQIMIVAYEIEPHFFIYDMDLFSTQLEEKQKAKAKAESTPLCSTNTHTPSSSSATCTISLQSLLSHSSLKSPRKFIKRQKKSPGGLLLCDPEPFKPSFLLDPIHLPLDLLAPWSPWQEAPQPSSSKPGNHSLLLSPCQCHPSRHDHQPCQFSLQNVMLLKGIPSVPSFLSHRQRPRHLSFGLRSDSKWLFWPVLAPCLSSCWRQDPLVPHSTAFLWFSFIHHCGSPGTSHREAQCIPVQGPLSQITTKMTRQIGILSHSWRLQQSLVSLSFQTHDFTSVCLKSSSLFPYKDTSHWIQDPPS